MNSNDQPTLLPDSACPRCGATGSLRSYVWGMPTEEDMRNSDPRVVYGGCVIPPRVPTFACVACQADFDEAGVRIEYGHE